MSTDFSEHRPWRPPRWSGLFAVALFLFPVETSLAQAVGPAPAAAVSPAAPRAAAARSEPPRQPVLMGGVWKGFTNFLDNTLNNRRRMIQFAVLGMCLALYIMIWRR